MTMMYNPNNVTLEASPLTTVAEIEVGLQLCKLFGFNINPDNQTSPTSWGHVTCGGYVDLLGLLAILSFPISIL